MIDLTPIINAGILFVAAIVTVFVVPWIRRKTTDSQRDELAQWVEIAVAAAEQMFGSKTGDKKKAYVLDFLAQQGYEIDTEQIEALIESQVLYLTAEVMEK